MTLQFASNQQFLCVFSPSESGNNDGQTLNICHRYEFGGIESLASCEVCSFSIVNVDQLGLRIPVSIHHSISTRRSSIPGQKTLFRVLGWSVNTMKMSVSCFSMGEFQLQWSSSSSNLIHLFDGPIISISENTFRFNGDSCDWVKRSDDVVFSPDMAAFEVGDVSSLGSMLSRCCLSRRFFDEKNENRVMSCVARSCSTSIMCNIKKSVFVLMNDSLSLQCCLSLSTTELYDGFPTSISCFDVTSMITRCFILYGSSRIIRCVDVHWNVDTLSVDVVDSGECDVAYLLPEGICVLSNISKSFLVFRRTYDQDQDQNLGFEFQVFDAASFTPQSAVCASSTRDISVSGLIEELILVYESRIDFSWFYRSRTRSFEDSIYITPLKTNDVPAEFRELQFKTLKRVRNDHNSEINALNVDFVSLLRSISIASSIRDEQCGDDVEPRHSKSPSEYVAPSRVHISMSSHSGEFNSKSIFASSSKKESSTDTTWKCVLLRCELDRRTNFMHGQAKYNVEIVFERHFRADADAHAALGKASSFSLLFVPARNSDGDAVVNLQSSSKQIQYNSESVCFQSELSVQCAKMNEIEVLILLLEANRPTFDVHVSSSVVGSVTATLDLARIREQRPPCVRTDLLYFDNNSNNILISQQRILRTPMRSRGHMFQLFTPSSSLDGVLSSIIRFFTGFGLFLVSPERDDQAAKMAKVDAAAAITEDTVEWFASSNVNDDENDVVALSLCDSSICVVIFSVTSRDESITSQFRLMVQEESSLVTEFKEAPLSLLFCTLNAAKALELELNSAHDLLKRRIVPSSTSLFQSTGHWFIWSGIASSSLKQIVRSMDEVDSTFLLHQVQSRKFREFRA